MQNKTRKTENDSQSTNRLPFVKKFKRMSNDNKIKYLGGVIKMVFDNQIKPKEALAIIKLSAQAIA